MKILGLDCSTPVTAIALLNNDQLLVEAILNTKKTHSQKLMPLIDKVLFETGVNIRDVDGFAVSLGPGSFTGLRIGLTTVKALAWALNKPLVGIPTLDGLALNAQGVSGVVCPILNARRNEVYTCLYKLDNHNQFTKLSDYMALKPLELIEVLKSKNEQIVLLGDGVEEYAKLFKDELGDNLCILTSANRLPRASQIGYLGWKRLQKGEADNVMQISPLYIRKSEAEVKLAEKKRGSSNG